MEKKAPDAKGAIARGHGARPILNREPADQGGSYVLSKLLLQLELLYDCSLFILSPNIQCAVLYFPRSANAKCHIAKLLTVSRAKVKITDLGHQGDTR